MVECNTMKPITKAIVPVAGWGTRRLPITKAIEKCMLPIGNRPIVDFVVEDCVKAGVKDIYFIISPGVTQLKDYYSVNDNLEHYLEKNNKTDYIKQVRPPKGVNFHYIEQDVNRDPRYGTAIPVSLVLPKLDKDESVVVLMGDDFTYNADGKSDVQKMIDQARAGQSVILGARIDRSEVGRYGVIELDDQHHFVQIVEKPTPEEAPSNMINISKYLLSPEALRLIGEYAKRDDIIGEYYITVPLNQYVEQGGQMKVVPADGQYLDGGSVEGWLHANRVVLGDI